MPKFIISHFCFLFELDSIFKCGWHGEESQILLEIDPILWSAGTQANDSPLCLSGDGRLLRTEQTLEIPKVV